MGCDIHLHTEVKFRGKWEHMGAPNIDRDYELFAKMAGVRGDVEAIALPRGVPNDISLLTKIDLERWEGDGHSHSWLTGEELDALGKWYEQKLKSHGRFTYFKMIIGYLFGNNWDVKKYPKDYPDGVEDSRAVFWFDN